jgi:hypothetical protein
MSSGVYALRAGDSKKMLGRIRVQESSGGDYQVQFWMVTDGKAYQGVGFTVTGRKTTDFLTWSDTNPYHVWTEDDQVHVVHDLCVRGLKLSTQETDKFMRAWVGPAPVKGGDGTHKFGGEFAVYQRSRQAAPPKTYTFAEALAAPWGKPLKDFVESGMKSQYAGPVTEEDLQSTKSIPISVLPHDAPEREWFR